MLRVLFLGVFTLGTIGLAELPPVYPKRLEAVLVNSLTDKTPLHIVTGNLQECEELNAADSTWVLYKCTVDQSYALISHTSTQPVHVQFDKVLVQYSKHEEKTFRKYSFVGNWVDNSERVPISSKVVLFVYQYDDAPGEYKGFLELIDYDTKQAISAVEVPAKK